MFPMISGVKELDDVLAVLEHVKQGMDAQHIPYDHDVQIGTMIEVPSAALCADLLAGKWTSSPSEPMT
jgi:phosphotransferase system enzyme I (PtsI)